MKPIVIECTFTPQTERETRAVLEDVLEVLVRANQRFYRKYPNATCCPKCGGVRYALPTESEARTNRQGFVSVERMLVERVGSCGDVAAMVCARMRELEGKRDARVVLVRQPTPGRNYHAVVRHEGKLVDATQEMQTAKPGCGCP